MRLTTRELAPGVINGARLNLFDDAAFTLRTDEIQVQSPDTFTAHGSLADDPQSQFVLASEHGVIVANLWTSTGKAYQLRPIPGRNDLLAQELEMDKFARCANGAAQQVNVPTVVPKAVDGGTHCPSVIDALIVYTAQARDFMGGENATRALCNACIASTNLAYLNSGVTVRCHLARAVQVDYVETDNFSTDLLRLRVPGDGFLDDVQGLRDACGADTVCLLVASSSSCGIGYVMDNPSSAFEGLAYSVVSAGCAVGNLSFAHELGHNQGCQHNHEEGNLGAYPFSFGHRFTGLSGTLWRTVMSTSPGSRVPRFSNPAINYDGVPTGVPDDQADAADNAHCINLTSAIVAGFRIPVLQDCNGNGRLDSCDIALGTSADVNENGVPDECDSPPCAIPPSAELHATMPRTLDDFGVALAMSHDGQHLVVGSDTADDRGLNSGAADVFALNGNQWMHQARLTGADTSAFQQFGRSAAISADGSWIVIGAPRDGFQISDIGAAYVFHFDGAQWVQHAKLSAPNPMQADFFGISVAIAADASRVIVGCVGDDQGGPQAGAAFIFRRNADLWTLETKVIAGDAAQNSDFGNVVAISDVGDRVLIGARSDDHLRPNAGAAYVFVRSGQSWTQEAKLIAPDANDGDRFGTSVALAPTVGDFALIGAPRDDGVGVDSGAVYIYRRAGSNWTLDHKITAADGAPGRLFGTAVALSGPGSTALIGSPLDITTFPPVNTGVTGGSALMFRFDGTSWSQQGKLFGADSAPFDNLGTTVALGGSDEASLQAAVGAVLDDLEGEVDAGSVRVFATGSAQFDCNSNGLPDDCDIADGISPDANTNGIPDECEPGACPADVAGRDGQVNSDDLSAVIAGWGICPSPCMMATCGADVNNDCVVDIDDLVQVIVHWGPCGSSAVH